MYKVTNRRRAHARPVPRRREGRRVANEVSRVRPVSQDPRFSARIAASGMPRVPHPPRGLQRSRQASGDSRRPLRPSSACRACTALSRLRSAGQGSDPGRKGKTGSAFGRTERLGTRPPERARNPLGTFVPLNHASRDVASLREGCRGTWTDEGEPVQHVDVERPGSAGIAAPEEESQDASRVIRRNPPPCAAVSSDGERWGHVDGARALREAAGCRKGKAGFAFMMAESLGTRRSDNRQ